MPSSDADFPAAPNSSFDSPQTFGFDDPSPPRGRPGCAWVCIVLLVGLVVAMHNWAAPGEAPAAGDAEDSTGLMLLEVQGRYAVGAAEMMRGVRDDLRGGLYAQIEGLNSGSVGQRLRFIVIAGEIEGPEHALRLLDELDGKLDQQRIELSPRQQSLLDVVDRLYRDYAAKKLAAPAIDDEDRELLQRELGWFGELALAPHGGPDPAVREAALRPARRMVLLFVGGMVAVGIVGLAGFIGLIVFAVMLSGGRLRGGLRPGLGYGGVYAETFAVWMLLFMVGSAAGGALAEKSAPEAKLLIMGSVSLFSLAALAWPVFRGVPWSVVRTELGLFAGRRPLVEPFFGPACYAMTLPIMCVGVFLTLVLVQVQALLQAGGVDPDNFNPTTFPTHPIVELLREGGLWGRLQLLFVASVVAPIVEEIMFRGVLYRHLRDATGRLGGAVSVIGSATLTGFVFAVIHPQGLVAVPALMAIAYGLTLAREWRETLIPSIIAHGINNGLILGTLIVALG